MNIDDLAELLDVELPDGDWDSVGGLVIGLLGHVPSEGEEAELNGNRFRAEQVQGRRIGRVVIETVDA
jgi:CBS domain containing-hemolysin-like protein